MRGSEKRKSEKKEDAGARKGRKVTIPCVLPMICGSRGSKRNLAKAAGAEPSGQMRDEKLHAVVARSTFPSQNVQSTPFLEVAMSKKCVLLWREAHFQVKMYKPHHSQTTFGSCDVEKVPAVVARSTFPSQNAQSTPCSDHLEVEMSKKRVPLSREAHFQVKMSKAHHVRTTFGSCDVEKVRAVVARSTFPSQNVQTTPCSDHSWKLRCRKSARRCGAKHISKSKCAKHTMFGPLLEVELSKKCPPLWREAHFQAKMYKAHHVRTTFGSCNVEKVHAVVARSTCSSQNVQSTPCSDHFMIFRCRKSACCCGAKQIPKSKVLKTEGFGPLFDFQRSTKCTLTNLTTLRNLTH